MTKTMHGKIRGRTIELDEDPGVAEGQQVEITIRTLPAAKQLFAKVSIYGQDPRCQERELLSFRFREGAVPKRELGNEVRDHAGAARSHHSVTN